MRSRLFDVAEKHAMEIYGTDTVNVPVFETNSGTWFGSVFAMMKVEPFEDWEFDDTIIDYDVLENMCPYLKEKKQIMDNYKEWRKNTFPIEIKGNEVQFTDLIVESEGDFGISIGRVYKYGDELGLISPDFDYLTYDLDKNIDYIAKDRKSPIIGLRKRKGEVKDRAVIAVMPLNVKQKKIKEAINRTEKNIKDLKAEVIDHDNS